MKKNIILSALLILTCGAIAVVLFTPDPLARQHDVLERIASEEESEVYVYETEAESADECASIEEYDAERGVCYFECEDETECAAIEAEVDAEFEELGDEYIDSSGTFSEGEAGEGPAVETTYRVGPNELLSLTSGEEAPRHHEVWKLFARISPDTFTDAYITSFEVSDDSEDDTLAYVHDEDGDGYWAVGVNLGSFGTEGKREDILTLVHEFAHIVTLNQTQVIHGAGCFSYDTGDGCATTQSYLNAFVLKFWPEPERTAALSGNVDVYARRPEAYATEYAATSPEEDIAESFALFVLEQKNEQPTSISEQKTAFFYAYPELVALRNSIRKGLGSIMLERKRLQTGE